MVEKIGMSHTTLIEKGDLRECTQCGYIWKPRKTHPVQCAKCRRRVIYNTATELETPTHETTGEGETGLELDLENNNFQNSTGNPENKLELELETTQNKNTLETDDNHPASNDEATGEEIHPGTGLKLKDLNNVNLYNKSSSYQGNKNEETEGKPAFKLPEIKEEQITGVMGSVFEDDEKAGEATGAIMEILKNHGPKIEKALSGILEKNKIGKDLPVGDGMVFDIIKGVVKVAGLKLFENKAKHERERIKERAQQLRAEKEAQKIKKQLPTPKPRAKISEDPELDNILDIKPLEDAPPGPTEEPENDYYEELGTVSDQEIDDMIEITPEEPENKNTPTPAPEAPPMEIKTEPEKKLMSLDDLNL